MLSCGKLFQIKVIKILKITLTITPALKLINYKKEAGIIYYKINTSSNR